MNRQMTQLCSLVDDLLDLTRITHNKIEVRKERLALNRLARLAAEDARPLFEKKGIAFEMHMGGEEIMIDGDPVRLRQIIGNLLHNAYKFTDRGGEVLLSVHIEKDHAAICIADDGAGIHPQFFPKLFVPFSRVDNSVDRRSSGLGLGLSITKGIAELHGGSVEAYSEGLGKGSRFCIYLPCVRDESGR